MDFEIVIVNDDRLDKAINQPFPILLHTHIHITIFVQCEQNHFLADLRDLCLFFLDALDQQLFLGFQLF